MFNNPYTPYQDRLNQIQPQLIQTIQQTQPQAICYFVNSKTDMQNIQVQPNVFYIGLNKQAKEIYVRSWNNDGLIDFDTYSLADGQQESTELKTIMDKLDLILKEKENARTDNTRLYDGQTAELTDSGVVQQNDGRKKSASSNTNSTQHSSK